MLMASIRKATVKDIQSLLECQVSVWESLRGVLPTPWIEDEIPEQTKDEDFGFWTLDLTSYEKDIDNLDEELKWSVSGVDSNLINVQIEESTDIVSFNSVENAYGRDTITFSLSDGDLTASQDVLVSINPVNDVPSAPSLVSPENDSVVINPSISLEWEESKDVDDNIIKYNV